MADEGDDGSVHRGHRTRRVGGRRTPHGDRPVSLITTARRSRLAGWRHRRHLYATLQLARIPLFIIAVAVYGLAHQPVIAACVAVVSLPLPWIAVLLANETGDGREKGEPKVYKPALVRENRARIARQQLAAQQQAAPRELDDGPEVIDADDPPDASGATGTTGTAAAPDNPDFPVPETDPETYTDTDTEENR
jgi:hypothetical protein